MTPTTARQKVIIVTGVSGAGRRTAAHVLEDLGWYVVDNLPPSMLTELVRMGEREGFARIAVVLDVRSRSQFQQLPTAFDELQESGVDVAILFLEASDEVIVRRQESVRRPMPLQGDGSMLEGIEKERHLLAPLRAAADMVLDTSSLNVHQMQERVAHAYGGDEAHALRVAIMSFGFKNGLPIDADFVTDVRFLPNPHWVPELRPMTGLSDEVSSYVLSQPGAEAFLQQVQRLMETVSEGYLREGKRLVTIGVGCTGGKHRSTAMAAALGRRLTDDGFLVKVIHRDLGRE